MRRELVPHEIGRRIEIYMPILKGISLHIHVVYKYLFEFENNFIHSECDFSEYKKYAHSDINFSMRLNSSKLHIFKKCIYFIIDLIQSD